MKFFILLIAFTACGSSVDVGHEEGVETPYPEVAEKFDLYFEQALSLTDEEGFVTAACDSLLFTSLLYAFVVGDGQDIPMKAMDDTGRLWRTWERSCLRTYLETGQGGSRATISLDMVLGWLIWVKAHGKWWELNRFIDYMESVGGKIGDHDGTPTGLSRIHVYKTPQFHALLYHLRKNLGGNGHWTTQSPIHVQSWDPKYSYPGHLQSLRALLWAKMFGKVPQRVIDVLKQQLEWNPKNALYQALLHKFGQPYECPVKILMDERLFPNDRLPTTHERCSGYLWERDPGKDYEPCRTDEEPEVHPGVDFIVAAGICLGRL